MLCLELPTLQDGGKEQQKAAEGIVGGAMTAEGPNRREGRESQTFDDEGDADRMTEKSETGRSSGPRISPGYSSMFGSVLKLLRQARGTVRCCLMVSRRLVRSLGPFAFSAALDDGEKGLSLKGISVADRTIRYLGTGELRYDSSNSGIPTRKCVDLRITSLQTSSQFPTPTRREDSFL